MSMRATRLLLLQLQLLLLLLLTTTTSAADDASGGGEPLELTDANWQHQLLDGSDWLVKFYAPWCPACQQAAPMWRRLAAGAGPGLKVAQIDVAANQIVGGMFLVTRLPTVYLVHDGQFWQYDGASREGDLLNYVATAEYKRSQPLAWYRTPTAVHMRLLGYLLKVVVSVKELHAHLTEEFGLPPVAAYAAVAGIAVGVAVALIIGVVCLCDCVFPPTPPPPVEEEEEEEEEENNGKVEQDRAAGAIDEDGDGDGDEAELRRRQTAAAETQ